MTLRDLLLGRRVWDCPCGHFRAVTTRRGANSDALLHALGQHYLECVVAQADVGLRQVVDRQGEVE